MNVRKRGLALLMCICMIFTLLPFSALADATAQDVVYGSYDSTGETWTKDSSLTAESSVKHYPAFSETSDNDANIDYSKTAVKNDDGSYNVTLTIKSKTSKTAPGASAVVLVIDTSTSMRGNRIAKAKEVATKFVNDYGQSGDDRYVAIVNFGELADAHNFGTNNATNYWLDASNEANRTTIINEINGLRANGGTNLEQGLSVANSILSKNAAKDIAKDNKFVIALTDGKPTYAGIEEKWSIFGSYYGPEQGNGSSCTEAICNATETTATTLKGNVNTLYTVCYGAEDEGTYTGGLTVGEFLKQKIASPGKAYNAKDGDSSLSKAFAQIYHSIEQGISSGFTVTDPMGKYVNLDSASLNGNGYSVSGSTITWEPKNGTTVDNPDGSGKTTTYTLTYKVTLGEVPDDGTYPLNKNTTLKFKDGKNADGSDNNVTLQFNVPGVKGKAPTYTVTYKPGDHGTLTGADTNGNVVTSGLKKGDNTPAEPPVNAAEGYYFIGWDKEIAATVTGNATYTAQYAEKIAVTFTGESGEKVYKGSEWELNGITVTGLPEGYTYEGLTYSASGTNVGSYDGVFSGNVVIRDAKNNDVTQNFTITKTPGKLTITPITDKVTVTITGNHDRKVYNGTEQSVTGYTTDVGDKPITVALKDGKSAEAKGTDVGKYMMGLTVADFTVTSKNYSNIEVEVVDGYLEITPITEAIKVTITGNHDSKVYNGTEQSVTGYTTDVGDKPITVILKDGKSAEAKGTDVAKYMMGLTVADFTVTSKNYSNIEVEVVDGYLEITPIMTEVTVKITGNNKTVTYNGKEQSVEGYVADTNGLPITVSLATGKVAEAKGTDVGTYYMQLTAADFVVTSDIYANIKVIVEDGWLKINRRPMPPVNPPIMDEIIVEITGNSDSVVYDGTEHSVKGYTVKISDPRYTEKDFTFTGKAEASGVNAGTYEMGLKAEQFKNTNARFTNVKFVIKADGVLTITPKELTITAGSKTEYGPTPVTCDEWTVSGLVAGDKVESVKITGIQSVPGSSPNVPSDAVIKNAKGEDVTKNYAIKYVNGTLTMLEVLNKEDHFNYIIGTPEGLSLPTANVTRAEVATIFFRLMTDDARAKFDSLDNSFSDVAKGKWYNRAISTLAKAGIIKGDPAGTYRPGDPITRAEMAAIIARFGDFKEGGKTFSDISGHWAQKYIELAASNGWINGNPDGTFKPNNNITRAETVAMINRVLDRQTKDVSDLLPVSQMTNWSDNMDTAKWYYRDMQEATNNHKAERVGNSIYEKWTEKLPDIDWASYQI